MIRCAVAAAIAFLPAAAAAQSLVLPAEFDRAWGRGSSTVLGGNSTRTQMIFASPFPPGTVLTGIGVRPTTRTSDAPSFTADIEVRVSSTNAAPGALSATFSSNVGSDETVAFPRQLLTVPAMPANRSTGLFFEIPFAAPFVFGTNGSPNVCVEVIVYSRSAGAIWSTDRGFASASGRAATVGIGCGTGSINSTSTAGTSGSTYTEGSTIAMSLSGAAPNALALLLPSFDLKEALPGLPLPVPLAQFGGAVGCDLLVNPNYGTLGVVTDAAGSATVSLNVPTGLRGYGTGWQWAYFVPASSARLPIETTPNRAIFIGPEVIGPAAQYVWDLSSANSMTGTATTDSVPVVKFLF